MLGSYSGGSMRAQLSDLDGLVERVRDPDSRDLIVEAVTAYRAGALRSAIMMCWSAVFGDMIVKIREMADEGNKQAAAYIGEFDRNISNQAKMTKVEVEVIQKSHDEFSMFDHRDKVIFERIKQDRNACAHPALAGDNGHFSPTPELVRAHLAHALDRLLVRPPAQGKEALLKLWRDLDEERLPQKWSDAVALVQARYVDQATETLRRAICKGAVRGLLLREDPFGLKDSPGYAVSPSVNRRRGFLACLDAIGRVDAGLQADSLNDYVKRLEADGQARSQQVALLALAWKPSFWSKFAEPTRAQILTMLDKKQIQKLSQASIEQVIVKSLCCVDVPAIKDKVLKLAQNHGDPIYNNDFNNVIVFDNVPTSLKEYLLERFGDAGSFRAAKDLYDRCIWPIREHLTGADLDRFLVAVAGNGQIWHASGIPERLADLFVLLHRQRCVDAERWSRFWHEELGSNSEYGNYDVLRVKLVEAGVIEEESVAAA